MAIFGVIAVILALIFPIGIIALIVYLVARKKSNNDEKKDDFEKIRRTVYTYILVLAFLIAQFVFFFWSDIKENSMEFAIYVILNDVFALLFLYEMIASSSICGIVFIVVAVSLLAGTEWKFKQKNNDGKIRTKRKN